MSNFTKLPQDMLQWEIASYLNSEDRTNLNQVVRPDERVYKKFDGDFAIRHHITVSYNKYTSIISRVRAASDTLAEGGYLIDERAKRQGIQALNDMFAFISGEARMLVQYIKHAKPQMTEVLKGFSVDDTDIYDACSRSETRTLLYEAEKTLETMSAFEFIRPIKKIKTYMKGLGMV